MRGVVYELVLPGLDGRRVRVISFEGWERLSEGYAFDLTFAAHRAQRELPRRLLGESATFVAHLGRAPRFVHGILNEITLQEVHPRGGGEQAIYRARLVPRMWLLTRRRRSRVFQRRSVQEVVQLVLGQMGIPSLWQLTRELPRRDYLTQYEETDEVFVRRLTAEAGIFSCFLHPPLPPVGWAGPAALDMVLDALDDVAGVAMDAARDAVSGALGSVTSGLAAIPSGVGREVVVFGDHPGAYPSLGVVPAGLDALVQQSLSQVQQLAAEAVPGAADVVETMVSLGREALGELGGSAGLRFHPDGGAMLDGETDLITRLQVRDAVRADHATFRTYDPQRPLAVLEAREPPLGGPDEVAFELYDHHDPFLVPDWDYLGSEAKRILHAERRDHRMLEVQTTCSALRAGARFHVEAHPADWANREYAAVEVRHRGHGGGGVDHPPTYQNDVWAVPANQPFVPERPPRPTVQTCLTATVIGTAEDTELDTRGMAEVKVRFHWDREQRGTCWLRCMQAWGGAGWGVQFMPRVGMEVVVGFDGGDPDRPLVLGCVYNGTHPTPFPLPLSQTRSGIRTASTPGEGGHNELSFEDRRGEEQILVHAERDLDVEVEHDRSGWIQHDDRLRVDHDQTITVAGTQREEVHAGQHLRVRRERRVEVEGGHEVTTRGDLEESVTGRHRSQVRGPAERLFGAGTRERVTGDAFSQVSGNRVELVGSREAPRSRTIRVEGRSEIGATVQELTGDEELVLRVGQSAIRITDERIELHAPEIVLAAEDATATLGSGDITLLAKGTLAGIADTVAMKSNGASLGLSSEAALDGSRVLLNSPETADDAVEHETPEPTVIELVDQEGQPLAYERYEIQLEDGSTRSGVLDADGRAEAVLDQGGEVVFPDLGGVEPS